MSEKQTLETYFVYYKKRDGYSYFVHFWNREAQQRFISKHEDNFVSYTAGLLRDGETIRFNRIASGAL